MKPICRILSLSLALALPLCALAEDDSRRWVEDITKMKSIPLADTARIDPGFTRSMIMHSGDVAAAALSWAETDILHGGVHESLAGDLSLFVMQDPAGWYVSIAHGGDTAILVLDRQSRLLRYSNEREPAVTSYEGYLPEGTDEAVLSYIEHFARMNGYTRVTGYERIGCAAADDAYDVRVSAKAELDGRSCTFTISLATMGFTEIICEKDAFLMPMTTPVPASDRPMSFSVLHGGENITVQAIDKRGLSYSFSPWPADAMPREEVFAIALQALADEFGVAAAEVTAEPFEYGYDTESAVALWQLDFACPSTGKDGMVYTVHVRDSDGAVMGVWGPDEANG